MQTHSDKQSPAQGKSPKYSPLAKTKTALKPVFLNRLMEGVYEPPLPEPLVRMQGTGTWMQNQQQRKTNAQETAKKVETELIEFFKSHTIYLTGPVGSWISDQELRQMVSNQDMREVAAKNSLVKTILDMSSDQIDELLYNVEKLAFRSRLLYNATAGSLFAGLSGVVTVALRVLMQSQNPEAVYSYALGWSVLATFACLGIAAYLEMKYKQARNVLKPLEQVVKEVRASLPPME